MKNRSHSPLQFWVSVRAALIVCGLLFSTLVSDAGTLLSCSGAPGADEHDRGFYIPSYPGITLETVQLKFSGDVAGTYVVRLTVRKGAYNGSILGTTTASVDLNGLVSQDKPAVFSFGSVSIAKGTVVCFDLAIVSRPNLSARLYYAVWGGWTGGCPDVIETHGTTPPLDSLRGYGVDIVVTGEDNLLVAPGGSIQQAIDHADPGDTVSVKAGTYNEDLVLRSDVNVIGSGFNSTILRGSGISNVVAARNVTNTRFEGFKITHSNPDHNYGGVYIDGGNLALNNNWIIGNANGIWLIGRSSAIIRNNIIENNGNNGDGTLDYGIVCLHSTPLIANNLIITNQGVGIYFGWSDTAGAQAINNTIVNNTDNGIWCYNDANAIIKNNILTGNSTGISASHGSTLPIISFNDVWNNRWLNYDSQSGGLAVPGVGDISVDPQFDTITGNRFALSKTSPCINAGDPDPIYNDLDGTRNDMGAYGGPSGFLPGLAGALTSGFLFNNIGKIPTSEITHTGPLAGLANVAPGIASALHIYQYQDAPFGGWLWIHGLFGSSDTLVGYYTISAAKWNGSTPPADGDFQRVLDPLTKIRYTVTTDGKVIATPVTVGPNDGGFYQRTDSGYWAFPDLMMIWNSVKLENGKYDLICKGYTVVYIPLLGSSLYVDVPLPTNELSRVTLHIDNSPVTAVIESVRDPAGTIIPECGLIPLATATDNLQFEIRAYHPNGFLRDYAIYSYYGRNRDGGIVAQDHYAGSHDATPPLWYGPNPILTNSLPAHTAGTLAPWTTCTYQFHLEAWARTTDGFNHIYAQVFNDHYFLNLGSSIPICQTADLDGDGDVDGADLAIFASRFGSTNKTLPIIQR